MPRLCTVCHSSFHLFINTDLAAGHAVRHVARRYGLRKSSVARHWAHHRHRPLRPSAAVTVFLSPAQAVAFARGLADLERLCRAMESTSAPRAPATQTAASLPATPLLCPTSPGMDAAAGYPPIRRRVEPVRHPYVPRWLPFRLEREFMQRFHAAIERAKEARGGRWRSRLDEVLTTGRILGGLHTAYRYGRTSSQWGRSMRGKRGQQALQRKVAASGWQVSAYFAALGRRGGLAKARKRRQPYVAWQQGLAVWPQQTQPQDFMGW